MSVKQFENISVESISHEGMGICRVDGKVYFVEDALPGEVINFSVVKSRRRYSHAIMDLAVTTSAQRVEPECQYFGTCGGCSLQHMSIEAQLSLKHNYLVDSLERIGKCKPEQYLEPMFGEPWHYRRKARLGVKYVPKKGGVVIGFRERHHNYINPTDACPVLTKNISRLLVPMREMIEKLSVKQRLPQVEVADADNTVALIFRHLQELNDNDVRVLREFAINENVQVFSQIKGPKTVVPIYPDAPEPLNYSLPEFGVSFQFTASDFIQVNAAMNEKLVAKAINFLAPTPEDRILDLFCGLGNFSLPIAKQSAQVFAVDMDEVLINNANINAKANGIDNVEFLCQNLAEENADYSWLNNNYNKLLLDPSRAGADTVLLKLKACDKLPELIVYVSCNPSTLARDADILVNQYGYTLRQAGIANMFPHTSHVEAISVFEMRDN